MNTGKSNQYEVLSPWAEVDPLPVRGISPRISELAGKKIGLFYNGKRAAQPIMTVVEKKLKESFPSSELSHFVFAQNREVASTGEEEKFRAWAEEVDTVVSAVGD
jgi:hypothetical protein